MQTSSVRQGQVEVGIVSHQGQEFVAMGASVVGRRITAYTRLRQGEIILTSWTGKTIVGGRSKIVERFADGSLAIIFRLGHERFLVGYALGQDGMLFRGELIEDTQVEARWTARIISDQFAESDAEDDTNAIIGTEDHHG